MTIRTPVVVFGLRVCIVPIFKVALILIRGTIDRHKHNFGEQACVHRGLRAHLGRCTGVLALRALAAAIQDGQTLEVLLYGLIAEESLEVGESVFLLLSEAHGEGPLEADSVDGDGVVEQVGDGSVSNVEGSCHEMIKLL